MQLIEFETALLAKKKGFDKRLYNHYLISDERLVKDSDSFTYNEMRNVAVAPYQTKLQKWLREEKGVLLWVEPFWLSSSGGWAYCFHQFENGKHITGDTQVASDVHLSFEEALEEGLQTALNLLDDAET